MVSTEWSACCKSRLVNSIGVIIIWHDLWCSSWPGRICAAAITSMWLSLILCHCSYWFSLSLRRNISYSPYYMLFSFDQAGHLAQIIISRQEWLSVGLCCDLGPRAYYILVGGYSTGYEIISRRTQMQITFWLFRLVNCRQTCRCWFHRLPHL